MAKINKETLFLSSYSEVEKWAKSFTYSLSKNTVVALYGNLGSGKTSFVKACAPSFALSPSIVSSPTFSYLHIYEGSLPLFHFDLYRIATLEDFLELGFEEYFTKGGICFLEWPEIVESILPKETVRIHWKLSPPGRVITVEEM